MAHDKLRVAWFSSAESTSGYLTRTLLPHLEEKLQIDLYHDKFSMWEGKPAFHFLSAFRRHAEKPYDLFFYQLEDRRSSYFVRAHLGLMPGIVLFHDLFFTDDGPEPFLNSPWSETVKKFRDTSRPWPNRENEYKKNSPIGYREAGLSLIPLFSNELSHSEYRRTAALTLGEKESFYLPYPVSTKFSELADSNNKIPHIVYAGTPRIENRSHKALLALSELERPVRVSWLIEESEREEAEARILESRCKNIELVFGRTPARWGELIQNADIALHPLFSVFSQPGVFLSMSLMRGLPCIVTRFGSTEYLPDNIVFKVEAGETEGREIREVLQAIVEGTVYFNSELVRDYAKESYSDTIVASELFSVFANSISKLRPVMERWNALENDARLTLLQENTESMDEWGREALRQKFLELGWA